MSASEDLTPTPREALGETLCSTVAPTPAVHETVSGRVVIVDHAQSPRSDPFVTRCFELAELGEVLDLATAIRVYEEIQVTRTRGVRHKVVGATVRREVAEVTEAGGPDQAP